MKWLVFLLLLPAVVGADPWYYQSDDSIEFWMPDKAQHFYGSQLLVESGMSPLVVFMGGILYELSQSEFSERDVLANTLGIVAAKGVIMAVDYSTSNKEITLRIAMRLK